MPLISIHVERSPDPALLEEIRIMSDATTALAASMDKLATVISKAVSTLDAATEAAANPPAAAAPTDTPETTAALAKAEGDLAEANDAIAATQKQVDSLTLQLSNSEAPVSDAQGSPAPEPAPAGDLPSQDPPAVGDQGNEGDAAPADGGVVDPSAPTG